jgi:four helix bundle protein
VGTRRQELAVVSVTLSPVGTPYSSPKFIGKLTHRGEGHMGASFKDLIVWQKSIQLSSAIYRLTASFPPTEQFGLSNQMRRASVSIASNIAEGNGRSTKGEYVVFLGHARASNCELQTQLTIACNLGFCSKTAYEPVENLSAEVSRMLNALMNKLKG